MTVKVRIAPSPTGNMHVGTAFAALFNWLFARANGGEFYLRIEDTDKERSKKEYEKIIFDGMQWLGLDWDNTEVYRQSERTALYRKHLEQLLDSGKAFWREYSAEEKAEAAQEGRILRDKVIVLEDEENPEREIAFDDAIRGRIAVEAKNIGQLIIAKDLDEPLYHFAVVIDDIEMGITHVIRGEEHISNTPKQLRIYEALGVQPPVFAHLPLMLGEDRSKLSKRNAVVSITEYQKDYVPEAFVNFIGSLSYTFEPELLTREEMIQQFNLAKVHKSGAIFDQKKLDWFNAQYVRMLTPHAFRALIGKPELPDAAVPIITERLDKLSDVAQFSYLWSMPEYDAALLTWKNDDRETAKRALQACADLADRESMTQEALDALAVEKFGGQKGSVYWPLRVALSGQKNSAGSLDIISVIGSEEAKRRIAAALQKLS